jgi:hypothetical protein
LSNVLRFFSTQENGDGKWLCGKDIAGKPLDKNNLLKACAKISSHFGASAGRGDARRRDAGNVVHCRGAATPQMPAPRRAPKGGWHKHIKYAMNLIVTFIIPGASRKM